MSTPPSPHWPAPSPQQPSREPALNGFALASLLVGLLCLPPLGIVFGIAALVQIARKGERGRSLAVVGLAVSVVLTLSAVAVAGRYGPVLLDRLEALPQYEGVEGELADMDELRAGDCFNVPGGDLLDEDPLIHRVACTQVHHAEVTSSTRFEDKVFPGTQQVEKWAADACWKAQDAYAMDTWALPSYAQMYYFSPSREAWNDGDRRLLCVIGTAGHDHRGSLRKDAGMLQPEQVAFLRAMNEADLVLGGAPDEEIDEALPSYREWAREVDGALGAEARMLEEAKARPEAAAAAEARLREVAAARGQWQRASRATRPADFQDAWDTASGALSVGVEKALRGAFGLSTEVPEWLADQPRDGSGPEAA
ncbi:DUF4190 domain-containing protein [Streptomyces sp. NPDC044571]|uniref:DUF4190 domain-containing protein n=1 Tax=Streptomyces sp. NPDC044571 TaxID=3155371 RepID=UPI00340D8EFD